MKVYNQIFELALSPAALKVYVYLSGCTNELSTGTVRAKTIAEACAITSRATVHHAVAELEARELIHKKRRTIAGKSVSNAYTVKALSGNYFDVPWSEKLFALPKAAFQLYLYLKMRSRANGRVWPTIRAMATVLKASCNTILDAIRILVSKRLLHKAPRWMGKHNLYFVAKEAPAPAKQEATPITAQKKEQCRRTQHCPKPTEKRQTFLTPIIGALGGFVKGCVHPNQKFLQKEVYQKLYTSNLTQQETPVKKKKLKLIDWFSLSWQPAKAARWGEKRPPRRRILLFYGKAILCFLFIFHPCKPLCFQRFVALCCIKKACSKEINIDIL